MNYNKDSIKSLDIISHIRKRPGMYLPDIGIQGLHHLVEEVLNNSVDEFMVGHGKEISISISGDQVWIADNGRGIPFEKVVDVFSVAMTSGKFDSGAYTTSSGLNGTGLKAVNALSSQLSVTVYKEDKYVTREFKRGVLTNSKDGINKSKIKHGTIISFTPDSKIFEVLEYDKEILKNRLFYLSSILPGLKINLDINGEKIEYYETDKLTSIQQRNLQDKNAIFSYSYNSNSINLILNFISGFSTSITSFTNTIHNYENGSHVDAVFDALANSLKKITGKVFSKSQLSAGIVLTESVFFQEPVYRGQHKGKVSDSRIYKMVYDSIYDSLYTCLNTNKDFTKYLVELVTEQERLVQELDIKRAINTVKNATKENRLPVKLAIAHNCTSDTRELFLCEGESAGGCYLGDTEIFDVNFNRIKFEDLEKNTKIKDFYTFSCSPSGNIEVSKIKDCFITKEVTRLVEINLDNGESFKCTTDHLHMLRDGTYRRADQLKENDSLMPIYYKTNGKRNQIRTNIGYGTRYKWDYVYYLSKNHKDVSISDLAKLNLDTLQVHHIDEDIKNDYPNNLNILTEKEYLKIHCNHYSLEEKTFPDLFNNHKIKKITSITTENPIPVYDLEVDSEYHNFSLAAGIFVHNSIKMARNKNFQEVLPLKGKGMNAFKAQYSDLLNNKEIVDIFLSIGGMESTQTIPRCKNVFILADADNDGKHISALLLSMFAVVYPSFVKNFNLYIVEPPLFSLISDDIRMYGHNVKDLTKKFKDKYKNKVFDVYRNKGLGEMNPSELEEFIHPKTRSVKKMQLTDISVSELLKLMGDFTDVRKLILEDMQNEEQV